ncbi:hypothetical protein [Sulfitobacter sp. SK011]|uniref:preATP grasp domain-containing protein n=1 Tax=Sulfitobacter sp. SK011 TaxID=1389004 RepID=UPI0013B36334|nr:hypothetical protein [Sulfitobacter sp. SK011]
MSDTLEKGDIADRLLADEPALLSSLDFGPLVAQGSGAGPSLLIGDPSEISLMRSARNSFLDHRMAHLAKPGDVVLVRKRDPRFEIYLKDFRGLDGITFLEADTASADPVAKQAFTSEPLLKKLADVAKQHGGLTITSYLTTGTIWHLAQCIAARAGCVVHVNGPAPRISARVNDKLWFAQLVKAVIGTCAVPPTMSAFGPKAAAAQILHLSKHGEQVIVKVPDSAGSAGNIRLDRDTLATLTAAQVEALLMDRLHSTGWDDSYPILVGVWDSHVTCSPSVQLWIPLNGEGAPEAHGVFEQRVFGAAAAFVGATRSTLPEEVQDILVTQALQISHVLQRLGYYGRCSFDAVLCAGDPVSIHWIECNGRWSGVSIPLAILNSLDTEHVSEGMMIIQEKIPGGPIETAQAIRALRGLLYRGKPFEGGSILLSPPGNADASSANVLSFAGTQCEVALLGQKVLDALRGIALTHPVRQGS